MIINFQIIVCLFGTTAPQWARVSSFTRFLDHTRHTTVGRTPLDEWLSRRRDLYLTTYNTHKRETSMSTVGFEPTISATARPLGPAICHIRFSVFSVTLHSNLVLLTNNLKTWNSSKDYLKIHSLPHTKTSRYSSDGTSNTMTKEMVLKFHSRERDSSLLRMSSGARPVS